MTSPDAALPGPMDSVAVIVTVTNDGGPRFRGTAFPLIAPGVWLTARHCVEEFFPEGYGLFSSSGGEYSIRPVTRVERHPTLDLAIAWTEGIDAQGFTIADDAGWGSEVFVVGYPEDLFIDRDGRDRPRARLLRGHIQRIESDTATANSEGDFELSFACPGGLSGSPVVLSSDRNVAGVVFGNHDSYVTEDLSETVTDGNSVRTHEVRRAVSFGAAADLRRTRAWLEAQTAWSL